MTVTSTFFPEVTTTSEQLEAMNPERGFAPDVMVARIGPSPTGMMHIGTLYVGLVNSMMAHQTGGRMILRLEDTDKVREVEGASNFIIESLNKYGVEIDEGPTQDGHELGDYGPYVQSNRREIYQAFAKRLLDQGKAYPCFASVEEIERIRREQSDSGVRTGYYGTWATWRDADQAEVMEALAARLPWVLRLRSEGDHSKKIAFEDCIFGPREMSENDHDIVILKSDGMPTYHFAHVVDDHLMRTTHVIRGDEWLASVPTHLQLFQALGWKAPKYAHVAPINKMEGASRRKLSKRKDPEASVQFFESEGYPEEAVLEYLLSLADSGFEEWRRENPNASLFNFPLSFHSLQAGGGPIFDFDKLDFVSKEYLAGLSATEVFERGLCWARKFDIELGRHLVSQPEYTQSALSIERGGANARKDIRKWSDLRSEIGYFFDDIFHIDAAAVLSQLSFLDRYELSDFTSQFLVSYDPAKGREEWFARLKAHAINNGFAASPKEFKRNPENYKGTIAHAAQVLRVLLTGSPTSPDLFSIMQVMGKERVERRLSLDNFA